MFRTDGFNSFNLMFLAQNLRSANALNEGISVEQRPRSEIRVNLNYSNQGTTYLEAFFSSQISIPTKTVICVAKNTCNQPSLLPFEYQIKPYAHLLSTEQKQFSSIQSPWKLSEYFGILINW